MTWYDRKNIYGDFIRTEFYGIFVSLVWASATVITAVYWISSKSIYFYYFTRPYWIRFHPRLYLNLFIDRALCFRHFFISKRWIHRFIMKNVQNRQKSNKRFIQLEYEFAFYSTISEPRFFIYLFIFSSYSQSACSKTYSYPISSTSKVRNDVRVCYKKLFRHHTSMYKCSVA